MRILGIDYGRSKIGISIADGPLAEPMEVIRYSNIEILEDRLRDIVNKNGIKKVIVGVSEGQMAKESRKFALTIGRKLATPVETYDETLSSQDAKRLSIEAGISHKKRLKMEDAYAATIILQNYLNDLS